MSHSHEPHGASPERRLLLTILLNAAVALAEMVGGLTAGSLSLLSDVIACHNARESWPVSASA